MSKFSSSVAAVTTADLAAPSQLPASVHTLENGLTVIHQQIITTGVVVVDVWAKAGALAEPLEWSGVAHFLEHMIFKGTADIPPGWFDYVVETRGGLTNAATSHDYAHYFIVIAADHVAEVLPVFASLLLQAAIPDDEFERERAVVLEEIRQSYDDPDWVALQALNELVYPNHAYGRSVLGSPDSLHRQSPEDMRRFHRAHYQPEGLSVVVVGNITANQTLDLVAESFAEFPEPIACPAPPAFNFVSPPRYGVQRHSLAMPRLEQARLLMTWTVPGVDNLDDAYGLDVLATLLADGRSSRLVKELREDRQWVQDISSSFSLQQYSSTFTIAAWLHPDHLASVEALIGDRLMELLEQPITVAELRRGQRLLANDFAFSTETPGQLAGLYGYYQTIGCLPESTRYAQRIQSYTVPKMQHIGRHYLRPETYTAVTLLPELA